jgi:uncharacterized alkaline shock family protein YloU
METGTNPIGNIFISHRAIASVAYHAVLSTYGVVGLTAKNIAEGLAQVIVKDPTLGVDVSYDGRSIKIDLYIIVEYGTRIKTVASSAAEVVNYQIENTIGLTVSEVNVHVRGIRVSDRD